MLREQLLACATVDEMVELITTLADGDMRPEVLKLTANVKMDLHDEFGNLKDHREYHNLITTAGFTKIALLSSAFYINQFAYCAIGTGTTAANIADTTLQTETARSTIITPTNPSATSITFATTVAAGTGTGAVTESGLLSAASSGTLLCRQVFSAVNKGASDTLTVTWTITLS